MKKLSTFLLLFCITITAGSQDLSQYKKEWLINGTDTLPYRILLPKHYDAKKQYPVILFLHGAGERGSDNEKQLVHGGKLFLSDSIRDKYPAIIVFPQCSQNSFWSSVSFQYDTITKKRSFIFSSTAAPTSSMKLLLQLVSNIQNDFKVKKDQFYVMGLSMGGMGTFEICNRLPGLFSAAIPICGGGAADIAPALRTVKWWVFHGAKDDVVPPAYSQIMVDALKKAGASVKHTVYPDANHNSWDPTFAEPGLLYWLFSQKKN